MLVRQWPEMIQRSERVFGRRPTTTQSVDPVVYSMNASSGTKCTDARREPGTPNAILLSRAGQRTGESLSATSSTAYKKSNQPNTAHHTGMKEQIRSPDHAISPLRPGVCIWGFGERTPRIRANRSDASESCQHEARR